MLNTYLVQHPDLLPDPCETPDITPGDLPGVFLPSAGIEPLKGAGRPVSPRVGRSLNRPFLRLESLQNGQFHSDPPLVMPARLWSIHQADAWGTTPTANAAPCPPSLRASSRVPSLLSTPAIQRHAWPECRNVTPGCPGVIVGRHTGPLPRWQSASSRRRVRTPDSPGPLRRPPSWK